MKLGCGLRSGLVVHREMRTLQETRLVDWMARTDVGVRGLPSFDPEHFPWRGTMDRIFGPSIRLIFPGHCELRRLRNVSFLCSGYQGVSCSRCSVTRSYSELNTRISSPISAGQIRRYDRILLLYFLKEDECLYRVPNDLEAGTK